MLSGAVCRATSQNVTSILPRPLSFHTTDIYNATQARYNRPRFLRFYSSPKSTTNNEHSQHETVPVTTNPSANGAIKATILRILREQEHLPVDPQQQKLLYKKQLYYKHLRRLETRQADNIIDSIPQTALKNYPTSGYGWTISAIQPQSGSARRKWVSTGMLKPYAAPLLVHLLTVGHDKRPSPLLRLHSSVKATMNRVYASRDTAFDLNILTAYVDKVSIPSAPEVLQNMPSELVFEGNRGASFFWTSMDKLHISDTAQPVSEKAGSLAIRLYPQQQNTDDTMTSMTYQQFQVNLADTIFQLQQPTTMHLTRISCIPMESKQGSGFRLEKSTEISLEHANVRLDIHGVSIQLKPQPYVKEARVALTDWRLVTEISGNVVKNLQGPKGPIPASAELEIAISKLPANEHGSFEVWAEVKTSSITENTFTRVVGGGGGWGDKRGLVALDPDSTPDRDMPADFDPSNLFPGRVRAGHEIRFVKVDVQRSGPIHKTTAAAGGIQDTDTCIEKHGSMTFTFGTNGATNLKGKHFDERKWHALTTPRTIIGHFGAMSSRMKYEVSTLHGDGNSIHSTDLPPYTSFTSGTGMRVPVEVHAHLNADNIEQQANPTDSKVDSDEDQLPSYIWAEATPEWQREAAWAQSIEHASQNMPAEEGRKYRSRELVQRVSELYSEIKSEIRHSENPSQPKRETKKPLAYRHLSVYEQTGERQDQQNTNQQGSEYTQLHSLQSQAHSRPQPFVPKVKQVERPIATRQTKQKDLVSSATNLGSDDKANPVEALMDANLKVNAPRDAIKPDLIEETSSKGNDSSLIDQADTKSGN